MNMSAAVSMPESPNGVQGAVSMSLLKKTQDMQAQTMQTMMESIKSVSPGKGGKIDVMG